MMVASLLALIPAPVLDQPRHVALRCGGMEFAMVSQAWADRPSPTAPARQTLARRVGARSIVVTLEPSQMVTVEGHRVRNSYVQSWACVTGARRRQYLYLSYACAVDRGYPHDCGGEQEWYRLIDVNGRMIDASVPRSGAARDRLDRRLGLEKLFEAGVDVTSVVG